MSQIPAPSPLVSSASRFGLRQLLNPLALILSLWGHRDLIRQMVKREVGQRYQGSYLGVLWSFITPLLMLLIYTFVFSVIFKSRWLDATVDTPPSEFALILFAGLAAFNLFAEVVNRAPMLILAVPNFVKKVVFPLEILPVVAIGSALVNSLIAVGLVLLGSVLLLGHISPTIFLFPLAYVPLVLLTLSLGWFLASLGVYVRDVGQGISLVVQMLFFLSPVLYPPTAVPEPIRSLLLINPLTPVLTTFRQTLLWGEMPDWGPWVIWTAVLGIGTMLSYAWFMKTSKGFADVL